MRIYIVNLPLVKNFVRCGRWQGVAARGKTLYYPIWLSYAAGFLEQQGHIVKLVDAVAKDLDISELISDLKNFKPDMIVADSNFSSWKHDIKILKILKNAINAKTVIVGPPVSQYSEEMVSAGIDIAARFEYEQTLKEICDSISHNISLDNVKGITFKKGSNIIKTPKRIESNSEFLDSLPFVSEVYKKHLDINDYFLSHSFYPMVQIFTGRGCPNYCTFCSWPETLMGRKYRVRTVKNVVAEFKYIKNDIPEIKEIFIEDDSFTLDKNWLISFCEELKRHNINISWSCQSRADLDYNTMKLMKEAGCRLLDVGYESGNDEILKKIKKGITIDQLRKFTFDAKKAGLKILADFVIGFPGETKETAEKTINFIKEIKPDLLQIAIATPIPGTEFYSYCKDSGYLLKTDLSESIDENGFQKCIISYPWLNSYEIQNFVESALKEYYLNIAYLPVAMKNIIGRNGLHELKSLLISAKMYFNYIKRNNES
ncbi:MAG: hopanoid biosynthesis associated radical SAM protein HpnJ [Methanobacteriaceae archaeon]